LEYSTNQTPKGWTRETNDPDKQEGRKEKLYPEPASMAEEDEMGNIPIPILGGKCP
jgi:hypothetical protein